MVERIHILIHAHVGSALNCCALCLADWPTTNIGVWSDPIIIMHSIRVQRQCCGLDNNQMNAFSVVDR